MRHMRLLPAGRHMDDDIFRQIWLDKLPVPMQQVLSMLDVSISLDRVASHADRISECYPVGATCVNIQPTSVPDRSDRVAISCPEGTPSLERGTCVDRSACRCSSRRVTTPSGPSRPPNSPRRGDYDDLKETVRFLCTQVSTMCTAINTVQSTRNQSPSRRRSKSRERPSTTLCWYHRVNGSKSRLTTGERPRQPVPATAAAGQSRPSRLFYISDKTSGFCFLVDTGAEICVIPPPRRHHLKPSQFSLQAANSTTINTYVPKVKPIELPPAAHSAFEAAKKALADATLLHHLSSDPHAQLILTTDAFNSAVGAVLHQQVNNQSQPLAFFSQKPQPAQTRYSTSSRELLAIYLAIRHFRRLLEGRDFSVHTDHKPLTYTLKAKSDRYSPREVRHLDYISQFTADIRYVRGSDNVVADALSRPDINTLTSDFDLAKLADLQSGDKTIDDLRSTTTLQLRDAPLPASPGTILCDCSTGTPRPVVPLSYHKTVFEHFHSLSHPGVRASLPPSVLQYIQIRIIRNANREGLIRSRLIGARQAKGDVLVFLDSHVRVSEDWLTFLLLRLALHHLKQTTLAEDKVCQAALSHTPYARLPAKFLLLSPAINELSVTGVEYPASEALRGGFDWDLTFTWEAVSEEEKERVRELDAAAGHWRFAARPTPSIAGCAFAMLRREFFRLGGLDEGMQIWGGENIELSLRTWLCGGRVEIVPCSRVAHLFRVQHPYRFPEGRQTTITRNLKRVAKVWMQPADEISMRDGLLVLPLALFFASRPNALSIGTGDLTGRENLKRDLQCRNFSWFLQSVYPELQMKAQSVDLFDAALIAARIASKRAP
nr:unnamed protein product [Spirometra erinaceieuropaei]